MSSDYLESKYLLSDFAKVTKKQWLEQVGLSLSGKDLEKFLLGKDIEGLHMYPYYTREDFEKTTLAKNNISYIRRLTGWQYQEIVFLDDQTSSEDANHNALKALEGGAESILFNIQGDGASINYDALLDGIYRDAVDISWQLAGIPLPAFTETLQSLKGTVHVNPLENYITEGVPIEEGLNQVLDLLKAEIGSYRCLSVSGELFTNSGASVVQELGLSCALLVEYLDYFTDHGLSPEMLFQNLELTLSTRSAYLVDIAKFRAIVFLVNKIAESYKLKLKTTPPIRAVSGIYNKTDYDLNANLLRNTTEAMAAVLGSCQKLCLFPHNGRYRADNDFGRRIARNISHLLRHESHLDLVIDPLAGSYALESLTTDLTREAWRYFQQIESDGGLLSAFRSGKIQREIGKSAAAYLSGIRTLQQSAVGANRYVPSQVHQRHGEYVANIDLSQHDPALLSEIRGPAVVEGIRKMVDQEVEHGKKRPMVVLLTLSEHSKASVVAVRTAFVQDILTSIGVEVLRLPYTFQQANSGSEQSVSQPQALVIIGDDEEYQALEPAAFLKQAKVFSLPIFLAGYPANVSQHAMEYGVQSFIHARMDVPGFADLLFKYVKLFDI